MTMLPGGGVVIPSWRPGTSEKPTPSAAEEEKKAQTASDLAKFGSMNEDNWLDFLREEAMTNEAAREKYYDYLAAVTRDKTANEWTAQREDSAWQRAIKDLESAGVSPYILSGGAPSSSRAIVSSFSGSQMTSAKNNENTNSRAGVASTLALMGIIISALLHAI